MSGKPFNFSQALDELEETLEKIKPHLDGVKDRVQDEARRAQDAAAHAKDRVEERVKENPWAAIGLVGLAFFVLGFLFGQRRRD